MKVIYVDDEKLLLENFGLIARSLSRVSTINLFAKSSEALAWVQNNPIDIAFLDIEMPGISGIELAKKFREIDENIRIVFVTAHDQYALDAFGVDAIGYLLKPYTEKDIDRYLKKASYMRRISKKEIQIYTMPDLSVEIDGRPLRLGHTKPAELFALLVDRGDVGITKGEAVACLWPEEAVSGSVYWTTVSRLKTILKSEGVSDLIITKGQTKLLNTDIVDCDMYRMLDGDENVINDYSGEYLVRYSWAEERNAQLNQIKEKLITKSKL